MLSLQKLLGKDETFFTLFEGAAAEAQNCARALAALIKDPTVANTLHDLRHARQKNKEICERIDELVVNTFVTALEREDIESVASALYRIPKPIEKFAERYRISRKLINDVEFSNQVALLVGATDIVAEMVGQFKKGLHIDTIKRLNAKLQRAEAEADALEVELLHELYRSKRHSLKVIAIKDLYDLLEDVVDRCRDAGGIVTHVFLKNS